MAVSLKYNIKRTNTDDFNDFFTYLLTYLLLSRVGNLGTRMETEK